MPGLERGADKTAAFVTECPSLPGRHAVWNGPFAHDLLFGLRMESGGLTGLEDRLHVFGGRGQALSRLWRRLEHPLVTLCVQISVVTP